MLTEAISIQYSVNSDNVYSGSNKTCLESVSDPGIVQILPVSRPLIGSECQKFLCDWLNFFCIKFPVLWRVIELANCELWKHSRLVCRVSGSNKSLLSGVQIKIMEATRQIFYIDTQIQIGKILCWFFGHKCYPSSRLLSSCVIITQSNIFPENIFITFCPKLKNFVCIWHKENGNFSQFSDKKIC